MDLRSGHTVLEEDYDETYEPTEEEILQYCEVIGLDPVAEKDLLHIAKEGTRAPLPPDWKPVEDTQSGRVYYFNFRTNQSTWDHPCDQFYCQLLAEERKKRGKTDPTAGSKKKKSSKKKAAKATKTPATTEAGIAGPLNPLSSGPVLGPLRGLPPLKLAPLKPGGLAPVQPPPGMAAPGTVGPPAVQTLTPAPLTSTQKAPLTTSQPHHPPTVTKASLNPLKSVWGKGDTGAPSIGGVLGDRKNGDLLRRAELGGPLKISTQFEEEEEESSSSDISQGFRSKLLGQHLLDNKDIGLQSQEELHSSEAENSSEELRRLLHSSEEDGEDGEDGMEGERPSAPLGTRALHTGLSPNGAPPSPLLSPPIPSSLSPLPTATHRQPQTLIQPPYTTSHGTTTISSTRPTPSTAVTTANNRGAPINIGSSITPPPGLKLGTNTASTTQGSTDTTRSVPKTPSDAKYSSGVHVASAAPPVSRVAVASTTNGGTKFTSSEMKRDEVGVAQIQEEENKREMEKIREEHEAALKKLKEELSNEFDEEKEGAKREGKAEVERVKREGGEEVERVRKEGREELERVRRAVEEERAKEERELRDRKLKNMLELKKALKEEEEEEEARLVEEKEDNLRRFKQKTASEKEKEEATLRQEAARSRQELIKQLATEKQEEESRLRSVASQEMSKIRAEADREGEAEKQEARKEIQQQLQVFREEQEDKHNKERAEIEENIREQLEALKREEQLKVQSELERKQSTEEERERVVQQQQQAIAALQQELSTELEAKCAELQEQHRATLETVKTELDTALEAAKTEHQSRIEQERGRLNAEFESITAAMRKDHEGQVEQLKKELAASEEQYRKQAQTQSEKLETLQSDYDAKHAELQRLQQELEAQSQQVEREMKRLVEENQARHRDPRRRRGKTPHRETPLLTRDDLTHSSQQTRAGLSSSRPYPEDGAGEHRPSASGRRVKAVHSGGEERVMARSHDLKTAEDWSETSSSVGSMKLEELVAPPTAPNLSENLESIRIMLEQNQRTLLRVLAEEQTVAAQRAAEMRREVGGSMAEERHKSEETGKRMRTKSKRTSTKPPKAEKEDSLLHTGTIKSKLKEEVRALGELEKKLRTSRQLLFSGEQELRDLHSHLSEDLNSEGDGNRTRERRQPRSSSAAELRETVSDRDNTNTPPQSLRKRSVLRAPPLDTSRTGSRLKTPNAWSTNGGGAGVAEPPQPPSKQYTSHSSASSVGDEGKGGRRARKRGKEDAGHTWTGEGTQERVDERTRTPSEESQSSNPESEGEGSPGSHTESPTPPQHVSIGQLESQREMVKSLNSINRHLCQLTSQIRQGSPRLVLSPPLVGPIHYPTTPPHTTTARWAESVAQGVFPSPHSHPQHRRESKESTRTGSHHSHHTSRAHHFTRHADGHVTTSPAHMYPRPVEVQPFQHQTNWLQEFHAQFPGYSAYPPLPVSRPLSAPLAPYPIAHPQLVMDSDRNIHLVHM